MNAVNSATKTVCLRTRFNNASHVLHRFFVAELSALVGGSALLVLIIFAHAKAPLSFRFSYL